MTRRELQALPIQAHDQHGEWNYTIGPEGGTLTPIGTEDRARARIGALDLLADERLTGMSRDALAALAARLAPAQQGQTAQRCFEQRGGARRRAPGAGSRSLLSDADRVLVTVVYSRQICSQNVLSELLGINANTIGQAIAETRQLLTEHHHNIAAGPLRFTSAAALTEFVTSAHSAVPARSQLPDLLGDPTLTGMSRTELAAMTEQVGRVQDAHNERHRHRRRGGERLPGARGGVFTQKITNTERVLATVLYKRKLCTQDALAELFAVSRRTIGDVVREVGPILTQHGYAPEPATQKFPTAQALLDAAHAVQPITTRTP